MSIIVIIAIYFTIIGYGCLWDQYVWNNIFGHNTSCVPFVQIDFYTWDILSGIGALLTTVLVVGIPIFGSISLFLCFRGIYNTVNECRDCCIKNYEEAKIEAKAHKATEKAPLLQVNIDAK